jgi:putative signal transducing protein
MKKLLSFSTPVDAYLLQGRLETEGIRCEVRHDSLLDIYGVVVGGDVGSPSVWIARDEDLPLALEIANETAKASGWPWTCAGCRETNEPAFDACWSCGKPRGESSSSSK